MTETTTVPEGLVLVTQLPGGRMQISPLGSTPQCLAPLALLGNALRPLAEALLVHGYAAGEGLFLTSIRSGESITIAPAQTGTEANEPTPQAINAGAAALLRQAVATMAGSTTVGAAAGSTVHLTAATA
ncbi:hypothetical protein [Streptomyces sp. NPDC051364]|uniref:hypothetical protein n=1 Tax=Streptomyces sp. NPDC051364 TaxID=3155799 RepID=UPI003436F9FF